MIALSQQEKRILAIAEPLARDLGMEIVRIRVSGGKRPVLQVMAEKAGGAPTDVEDCAALSHALSPVLDVEDPIAGGFVLEVSTPGIDRPLTREGDFARWTGHVAKLELAYPLDGRRRFSGVLAGEDAEGVRLELEDGSELVAQVHELSKAHLVLTDELIADARERGEMPPQPEDEDLEDYELDESGGDDDKSYNKTNGAVE
ncbi:MAG: ribosome maturation factor RimP [Alphaproteobacteria bacterium]|jgi:ribosome maturation factor RimP|nr:ribosome maturation factor RimP [Alphaproteobacteria bacterium]